MSYKEDFNQAQGEFYWSAPRIIVAVVIVILALAAIGFVATGADLAMFKFWAPKYENARRQVFENTQSYVQGKIQHIGQLRLDYEIATGPQKEALRRLIITEASTVDFEKLPIDMADFIRQIGAR